MFFENVKIALRAIGANKMRSILTVLGVMIGVAAVIAVVSLVQGMQYKISKDLQSIGSTFIEVYPDPGDQRNPFLQRLPDLTGLKNEVIMPGESRVVYDHAVRTVGVKIIEVNSKEELQGAINMHFGTLFLQDE